MSVCLARVVARVWRAEYVHLSMSAGLCSDLQDFVLCLVGAVGCAEGLLGYSFRA